MTPDVGKRPSGRGGKGLRPDGPVGLTPVPTGVPVVSEPLPRWFPGNDPPAVGANLFAPTVPTCLLGNAQAPLFVTPTIVARGAERQVHA
jgi:hypothetical protein